MGKIDKSTFDALIGQGLGPRRMDYTWRDVALYAAAVGAKPTDLPYIYEQKGELKALPTFCLLPYINSITMQPVRKCPYGPNELLSDLIVEHLGHTPNRLHMAMDLTIHGPIDAMQGTFLTEDRVDKVYDWGDKGVVGDMCQEVYNLAGNHIATLHSLHYHAAMGNFGGEPFKSNKLPYPDRDPDFVIEDYIAENQAILYRLCGDTYNVHIDYEIAQGYGYKKPFMQGLGTYGFTTRMLIQQLIPYQPERVTHISAQFRSVCFPGQTVRAQVWKVEDGVAYFRLKSEDGTTLLDNGLFEYKH